MAKLENRDERLKKFEKAPIRTPQQQSEALQKAQAEIGSLTNERQALLKQQQQVLMGHQQQLGALQNQAMASSMALSQQQPQINVAQQAQAMNSQTQNLLRKYGVGGPQQKGSKTVSSPPVNKSVVAGIGTTNIKTENKTVYNTNTTNSVQVIQPQGQSQIRIQKPNIQVSQPIIQLRNQISSQIQSQNQQYEVSKKNYLKSDLSLRRSADMMMRKIGAASKRFAENMNPQKIAAASTDTTKVIMMMAVAYLATQFIKPISARLDKLYYWFTGDTPEGEKKDGKYNQHMGFFDRLKIELDTHRDDSIAGKISKFFKDGFEDIKGYLELVFEDRMKAIGSVKSLSDREKWLDTSFFGLKYIPEYLADIFYAAFAGTKGLAKRETRKQTKQLEEKGSEEFKKNQGLPSGSVLSKVSDADDLATKVGVYSGKYTPQVTKGGVTKNRDGSYSLSQIQAQFNTVEKNAKLHGSTIVSKEYAYSMGGKDINILTDEKYKDYASIVQLGRISLRQYKYLSIWSPSTAYNQNSTPGMVKTQSSPSGERAFYKEQKQVFKEVYESLVSLLDKKCNYNEGWNKETESAKIGDVSFKYEVYYYPIKEKESIQGEIKVVLEKAIEKFKKKNKSTNRLENEAKKISGLFESTDKQVVKIQKEIFSQLKKDKDIKEFNLADENAPKMFEEMAQTGLGTEKSYVGHFQQGETDTKKVNPNAKINDVQEVKEAQTPVTSSGDLDNELENYWAYRNQESSFLNSDFVKTIRGVASTVGDKYVDLRTNDSIEKSAPIINKTAEYLSQMLKIPKDAAIGIVSNLWAESRLNPIALGDGGSSIGVAQWHNERHKDVLDQIENLFGIKLKTKKGTFNGHPAIMIDTKDKSWQDLQQLLKEDDSKYGNLLYQQLNLIIRDLKEKRLYNSLYQQLSRSNNPMSPEDAAEEFLKIYEVADDKEGIKKKQRRDYASEIKRYIEHYGENFVDKDKAQIENYLNQMNTRHNTGIPYGDIVNKWLTEQYGPPEQLPTTTTPSSPEEPKKEEATDTTQNNVATIVQGGSQVNNVSITSSQRSDDYNPISNG